MNEKDQVGEAKSRIFVLLRCVYEHVTKLETSSSSKSPDTLARRSSLVMVKEE